MQNSRITPYVEGMGRVMITDYGPHPPEFWAQVTAEHVWPIHPDLTGARYRSALDLQQKIATALVTHHTRVQTNERQALSADANRHTLAVEPELHAGPDGDVALADIVAQAKGTEWEAIFARPDVQERVRNEVVSHFATAQHIERNWHADRLAGRA